MSFWDRKKAGQMVGAINFYLDCVPESSKREDLCTLRQHAVEAERSLSMAMGSMTALQHSLCSICRSEAIFHHTGDCRKERCHFLTITASTKPVVHQRVHFSSLPKGR